MLAALSCERGDPPLFRLLDPDRTGITFANVVRTNDSVNVQTDVYVYNGAGVAIGDVDNDGLPDIYLTGNMVSSRLYLNRGDMRFDDITERAGVGTTAWATGATMADVNGDGFLDIHVSVSGPGWSRPEDRANRLFLNNGNRTFTEAAARYGIADTSFTTHAVFLDYDADGCLDLFLLNNSPHDFSRGDVAAGPAGIGRTPGSHNRLYRNGCAGAFTDVSRQAGILETAGYGLGVAVGDLNRDGRPDIYVSNDAMPNDVLYVNNGDGTFTDKAGAWLKHASLAGMGVDIADFNDDGWPDILQVDMAPADLADRKRVAGFMTYGGAQATRARGFRDDYSMNTLQLSNGLTPSGDVVFSEVARMAGVAYTGWSWSALFADFDNDGRKDAFISNGYPKAVNDFDYQTAMFATRRMKDTAAARRAGLGLLNRLRPYELPNHVFHNTGNLTFVDRSREWGIADSGFAYGAAYADLNNDGRLDLVVNNIDAPASVYENVAPRDRPHHHLTVRLEGRTPHQRGIGATLVLTAGGRRQHVYHSPYRGYMSTMDDRVHFGLGDATRADTLEVLWPDGRRQVLTAVAADRIVTVKYADATPPGAGNAANAANPPNGATARTANTPNAADSAYVRAFTPGARGIRHQHRVSAQVDYAVQPLLPYMISRQGPALATGDVDGDGLEDVFVGGGGGAPGRLFLQRADGGFSPSTQPQGWEQDRGFEDWGALLFDANGDGRLDLYVASGGYALAPGSRLLQDRLYLNAGGGRFVRDSAALPTMLTSTAAVRAADFTGDGRPDLFVGGRLMPRQYPLPTRSYLLRNDGGRFTDVTRELAPALLQPGGMITDAAWLDFDGDRRLDLVTVGEWMPIEFHRNEGNAFRNVTAATKLPASRGWWFTLAQGDFDGDGRTDLVAGNLGLNHSYTTSAASRFGVYAADFFRNQTTHVVLTQEVAGVEYPWSGRVPLGREMYQLGLRFPTYEGFARARVSELFTPAELRDAIHYQADTFASVFLRNTGGGTFTLAPLPPLAQVAPVRAVLPHDVDGDGRLDLLLAGNLYETEPNVPRADAGNGLWLRGNGTGHFAPVLPGQSGLFASRDVAGMALVRTRTGRTLIVASTGDSLQSFDIRKP